MHMTKANVVIGANFGDEGKGLMTDYLSSQADIVIRFNGGAQAGHTVQDPQGRRHIFSHFGAGTLRGKETFLSQHFVVNPIVFRREREELLKLGIEPVVFVDPACSITTPYDIMINRMIEQKRGDGRHGSVGLGFGETVGRNLKGSYRLTVLDLGNADFSFRQLNRIKRHWFSERLDNLGLSHHDPSTFTDIMSDDTLVAFLQDLIYFRANTMIADAPTACRGKKVLFEGAQGLMLDQVAGHFPFVTRSNTGLRNAIDVAAEIGIKELNAVYVTRSYMTRHGAGPLEGELEGTRFPHIVDPTNKPNAWQGKLRFAPLDIRETAKFILGDLEDAGQYPTRVTHELAVTCCDQIPKEKALAKAQLLADLIKADDGYLSFGPTRNDVVIKDFDYHRADRSGYSRADEEWFFGMDGRP